MALINQGVLSHKASALPKLGLRKPQNVRLTVALKCFHVTHNALKCRDESVLQTA